MHLQSPTSAAVCSTAFYPNHGSRATPRISLVGKAAAPGRLTTTIQEKGGKRRPLSFHLTFVCSISLFCRRCLLPHMHIGPSKAERKSLPSRSVAQIETRMTGREFQMKIDAMPPSKRRARGERLISRLRPPLVLWRGKNHRISQEGSSGRKNQRPRALASSSFAQRNGDAQRYSLPFLARGKKGGSYTTLAFTFHCEYAHIHFFLFFLLCETVAAKKWCHSLIPKHR